MRRKRLIASRQENFPPIEIMTRKVIIRALLTAVATPVMTKTIGDTEAVEARLKSSPGHLLCPATKTRRKTDLERNLRLHRQGMNQVLL